MSKESTVTPLLDLKQPTNPAGRYYQADGAWALARFVKRCNPRTGKLLERALRLEGIEEPTTSQ